MTKESQMLGAAVEELPSQCEGSMRMQAPLIPEEGYARWAATYDVSPNPLLALEERHLLALLPAMAGKLVLDLACGTGRWLQKLLALGARTGIGVDCSAAMLRMAAGKLATASHLARADCSLLPFGVGLFDFAICSFALSHLHSLSTIAREFAIPLKPGAELVLSDVHPEAYIRGWRTAFRYGDTAVQIESVRHSLTEIVDTFGLYGFDCCALRSERIGEPEKPIFFQAGREHLFSPACAIPALLIVQFRRNHSYEDLYETPDSHFSPRQELS